MLATERTFHIIVGTNITAKTVIGYTQQLLPLFYGKAKVERNHKRKVEKLHEAALDVVKITDFLLNHVNVKALSDNEADSIEQIVYLASDLDITKRTKVINYIMHLNKQDRLKVVKEEAA